MDCAGQPQKQPAKKIVLIPSAGQMFNGYIPAMMTVVLQAERDVLIPSAGQMFNG